MGIKQGLELLCRDKNRPQVGGTFPRSQEPTIGRGYISSLARTDYRSVVRFRSRKNRPEVGLSMIMQVNFHKTSYFFLCTV